MKTIDKNSAETVAFANSLADKARCISQAGFRQDIEYIRKNDESPVTIIDQNVEKMMRDRVATTYPAHGFLGEEFESVNLDSPDIWVVDPIDGTRSFVTGWPMWGTLVAKLTQGTPDIGVIDMPGQALQFLR